MSAGRTLIQDGLVLNPASGVQARQNLPLEGGVLGRSVRKYVQNKRAPRDLTLRRAFVDPNHVSIRPAAFPDSLFITMPPRAYTSDSEIQMRGVLSA